MHNSEAFQKAYI